MKHLFTTLLLACGLALAASGQERLMLPYFQNFENGAAGWNVWDNNQGTEWDLGVPNVGYTPNAYSGSTCWDVNLNAYYTNNAECYLYSPTFDFTNVPVAHISFWTMYRAEYMWDYLSVQYTIDHGDSWIYLPFPDLINPDNQSLRWIESSLLVNTLYGNQEVQFRFRFISDGSVVNDGYSIDDFRIEPATLGISDPESMSFTLFPNPASDLVNLVIPAQHSSDASLTVYDAAGHAVSVIAVTNEMQQIFSVSQFTKGIYAAVYRDGKMTEVKRMVVE